MSELESTNEYRKGLYHHHQYLEKEQITLWERTKHATLEWYTMYPEAEKYVKKGHFPLKEAGYYISLIMDYLEGIQTPEFLSNDEVCMNFCGAMLRRIFHYSKLKTGE